MSKEKSIGQKLYEKLSYKTKTAWEKINATEKEKIFTFCNGYKQFLDIAKTERCALREAVKLADDNGYICLDKISDNAHLKPGAKIYKTYKDKSIILATLGNRPLIEGVNILGAHIDSPRIDLKQCPIYEDTEMVLLKTHYYGGIKKYQWVSIPLSLIGVIVKKDGSILDVCIGENENDPVFTITDLLPHLAVEQMQKKMSEAIVGEGLNILFGTIPYDDEKVSEKVKLNILLLLNEKYGVIEEDFISAELEIVPAFKAKDVGLDRGLVGGYGQDDRVCAYTALRALLDIDLPEKTAICYLSDKEEIGSVGNTGAESDFLENFISSLCSKTIDNYSDTVTRNCFMNTKMLSADVNPGVDPNFEGVQDKKNASYIGRGVVVQKYTGVRGKVGGSDANAEFVGEIRKLFNENDIPWQSAELGKVDHGGGGTIAQYVANKGADVIDCGVAILSMHSPFELTSKVDIYHSYKAFKVFLNIQTKLFL